MKIEIESTTGNFFVVKSDGKTSEELGWDELLGLVAALTIPDKKPCVHWMKNDVKEVPFEPNDKKEKKKPRRLIAIGIHDTYQLERLLYPSEVKREGVNNKHSTFVINFDLFFNHGVLIDGTAAKVRKDVWSTYIINIIDTLGESDHITIYNVYD